MPCLSFDALPDTARLWIFPATRPLSAAEGERVLAETDAFIAGWTAHGVPLTAARDLRHDRFLMVAADEEAAGVSGCSIDALVRRMDRLGSTLGVALGVDLVEHGPVAYLDGAEINQVPRHRFAALAASGSVTLDTIVFDNTITRVGDVRSGRWERPAGDAWHRRAFFEVRSEELP
jgi:hypothetical protein